MVAAQSYLSAQLKESTAEKEPSLHDVFSAVVSVPIEKWRLSPSLSLTLVLSLSCTIIFPVGPLISECARMQVQLESRNQTRMISINHITTIP